MQPTDGSNITVRDLKAHMGQVLGRVQFGGEEIVVTRNGKPAAALVPLAALAALRQFEDREDLVAARESEAEARARGTLSLADVRRSLGLSD